MSSVIPVGAGDQTRAQTPLIWKSLKKLSGLFGIQITEVRSGEVDWRSVGHIIDPLDQDVVNACVSYASCAVVDAQLRIKGIQPLVLAPRYLHFCLMRRDADIGADMSLVKKALERHGAPIAEGDDQVIVENSICQAIPKPPGIPVVGFKELFDAQDVKAEIESNGPVIAHMEQREDFWNWYAGGIYQPSDEPSWGQHAVCLVGYSDSGGYWIGKNSRGVGWGEQGFFRIAYGASGIASSLPVYTFYAQVP